MHAAIEAGAGGEYYYTVQNYNRSIGARLSGEIARRWGNYGMEKPLTRAAVRIGRPEFRRVERRRVAPDLDGDANDYVGKGMAGGQGGAAASAGLDFVARDNVIMGNTCLYGATGGELFAAGQAGERFAVRNSGVTAVVEGAGDHCCEYMTGGVICVLGRTGLNFGAGFTGGFAYVLDLDRDFVDRYNHELIDIHRINSEVMQPQMQHLQHLIERHVAETGSEWGAEILRDFRAYLSRFWLVKPKAASLDSLIEDL